MDQSTAPLNTVVLALPFTGTSTMFCILDVLSSVGRDWELLHAQAFQPKVFDARMLSLDGKTYDDVNGRRVTPEGRLPEPADADLVIVPDLHIDPAFSPPELFEPATE